MKVSVHPISEMRGIDLASLRGPCPEGANGSQTEGARIPVSQDPPTIFLAQYSIPPPHFGDGKRLCFVITVVKARGSTSLRPSPNLFPFCTRGIVRSARLHINQ